MKSTTRVVGGALFAFPLLIHAAQHQLLGWNNLGMHCMDSDYSVFSILPPYNTVEAQLIVSGKLWTNAAGYTLTYEAVADPAGSINRTAVGKGNFTDFDQVLYGADLAPEAGLAGWAMPGPVNAPQNMLFEATNRPAPGVATRVNWYRAEGIPITPWDDAGQKNPYPMMRIVARDSAGTPVTTNDIVLPVSDEMDCLTCHASGTQQAAKPAAGWVWSSNPERDYRLNILRRHDETQFALNGALYRDALASRVFNLQGLFRSVVADGKPVLCAACHASEALGTSSFKTIRPLTAAVHTTHVVVQDPDLGITLGDSAHRSACYRCHPGSTTKCLRGAMGAAVAQDGSLAIQCQSCHGSMSAVGASARVGWFMEPDCQSCHTGTAVSNNGQIRYVTCFEPSGAVRVAAYPAFATNPNQPAAGLSLYRFSAGHGGLQCSACHGSTHAEFPATHPNDNIRNERLQGHAGVTLECTACHTDMVAGAANAMGGPHGLHPIGQTWVDGHPGLIDDGLLTRAQCRACHGLDSKGTVLSRAQSARSLDADNYGLKALWRGQQVGCYDCHDGPDSENPAANTPATVGPISTNVVSPAEVVTTLPAIDVNGGPLAFRIVSQPAHGRVRASGPTAVYQPDPGYTGTDSFTYAAFDGWSDSNLATGTVAVAQGPFSIWGTALVPANFPSQWPVPFGMLVTLSNTVSVPAFEWDFGDGSVPANGQHVTHTYGKPGTYEWRVTARVTHGSSTAETQKSGLLIIAPAETVVASTTPGAITLSWPVSDACIALEACAALGPTAAWNTCTNTIVSSPTGFAATVPADGSGFYRLRLVR